jgi:hypothetical protein
VTFCHDNEIIPYTRVGFGKILKCLFPRVTKHSCYNAQKNYHVYKSIIYSSNCTEKENQLTHDLLKSTLIQEGFVPITHLSSISFALITSTSLAGHRLLKEITFSKLEEFVWGCDITFGGTHTKDMVPTKITTIAQLRYVLYTMHQNSLCIGFYHSDNPSIMKSTRCKGYVTSHTVSNLCLSCYNRKQYLVTGAGKKRKRNEVDEQCDSDDDANSTCSSDPEDDQDEGIIDYPSDDEKNDPTYSPSKDDSLHIPSSVASNVKRTGLSQEEANDIAIIIIIFITSSLQGIFSIISRSGQSHPSEV